jgi:hypothetical protein
MLALITCVEQRSKDKGLCDDGFNISRIIWGGTPQPLICSEAVMGQAQLAPGAFTQLASCPTFAVRPNRPSTFTDFDSIIRINLSPFQRKQRIFYLMAAKKPRPINRLAHVTNSDAEARNTREWPTGL